MREAHSTNLARTDSFWRSLRATLLGLQFKATVGVVGLMAGVAVTLCGLAVRQAWVLSERVDRERAQQHARWIAKLSADFLRDDRIERLEHLFRDLVTGDPFYFVYITDKDERTIVAAERTLGSRGGEEADRPDPDGIVGVPIARVLPDDAGQYLFVRYPIDRMVGNSDSDETELIGYVHLGLNRGGTIAEFDAAADLVIGIGFALVLGSIPMGFVVVRRLVEPLERMSEMTQRFSTGDLRARCEIHRTDEIGVLARNLNKMADEVAHKHEEIIRLNAHLEHRVAERTSQLRELASREPLTGLYNRRHFSEFLEQRVSEAGRYGTDLSVLMIDLDHFKAVNDIFGHLMGDKVLILVARTITSQLRTADVGARYGGDEFIAMLPHSSSAQAHALAERIRHDFQWSLANELPEVAASAKVSMSIGIASLAACEAGSADEFVGAADRALYEAKDLGRNRIVLAGALTQ